MNEILLKVFTYGAMASFAGLARRSGAGPAPQRLPHCAAGACRLVGVLRRVPFSYNYRNLVVRWRTTLLTTLAFILVVGLMTVMLAFVNGMYALTKGSAIPGNVMVLADGATDELFSDLGYGDISLAVDSRLHQEGDACGWATRKRTLRWLAGNCTRW